MKVFSISNFIAAPFKRVSFERDPEAGLSRYFPEGTTYFYAFPSGADSGFYNAVPPWIEELVAARTLVAGGEGVRPVTFAVSADPRVREVMEDICGVALPDAERALVLPEDITTAVSGSARDERIKEALLDGVEPHTLVMAQPFTSPELRHLYRIDPMLSAWMNDKKNMPAYVSAEYLPRRYASFENGAAFRAADVSHVPLPAVVKVSASSAGDGVRIVKSAAEMRAAQDAFAAIESDIFAEEFVEASDNFCIQFGIPHDGGQIDIIGYNRQVITERGEFLGGVVYPASAPRPAALDEAFTKLRDKVLPRVRALGWYGVGGMDVLISKDGRFFFIDSNFRQTATFCFVCLSRRGIVKKPLVSMVGTVLGGCGAFKKLTDAHANPKSGTQLLQLVSFSHDGDAHRFNAGLLFDNNRELRENARTLKDAGVSSRVLDLILEHPDLEF